MSSKAGEWLLSQNKYLAQSNFTLEQKITNHRLLTGPATTISIASGKGGVGKTSMALKFSRMLAEDGYKVLLIDCDFNLSNTAVKLGLPIDNNFLDLLKANKEFSDCLYKEGKFHLLAACNGSLEFFEKGLELEKFIIDIISTHENEYDFIFLDCPAGLSKSALILNAYSGFRFVVVTPDRSSVTDSYSLMKILNTKYGINDNHLLINKVSSDSQYNRLISILSETVEKFLTARLSVLGGIWRDNGQIDHFDRLFLEEKNGKIHQNFLKVLKRFSEECIGTHRSVGANLSHLKADDHGQDVQPRIS